MKPIAIVNTESTEFLTLTYSFTNVCNYDCNYCLPSSKEGTSRWPDYDLLTKNLDHMLSIYRNNLGKKIIRVRLLGGEPTLWPRLGEFVQWLHEKHQCRVTMSSNGSRKLRWWKEYAKYFEDIQISVHHEYADPTHLKEVLDTIFNEGTVMTAAQVLMDPNSWDRCKSILDDFCNHPIPWLVKSRVVLDLSEKNIREEYDDEQISYLRDKAKRLPPQSYIDKMIELGNIEGKTTTRILFKDGSELPYNTFDIWANKWHTFYGWECNLGVDRVSIQANGEIVGSCSARYMFNRDDPFSILDPDFSKKFTADIVKPVICKEIFCSGCSTDIRTPKKKLNV